MTSSTAAGEQRAGCVCGSLEGCGNCALIDGIFQPLPCARGEYEYDTVIRSPRRKPRHLRRQQRAPSC